jgi:hypothetical protein
MTGREFTQRCCGSRPGHGRANNIDGILAHLIEQSLDALSVVFHAVNLRFGCGD